jgi:rhodanese-related sulfurtransferase
MAKKRRKENISHDELLSKKVAYIIHCTSQRDLAMIANALRRAGSVVERIDEYAMAVYNMSAMGIKYVIDMLPLEDIVKFENVIHWMRPTYYVDDYTWRRLN